MSPQYTPAVSVSHLSCILGRGSHTRGFKKKIGLAKPFHQKFLQISKTSDRPIGQMARYFVESAIDEGYLKLIEPGSKVLGSSPNTIIEFDVAKKWSYSLDDLAWSLKIHRDSSNQLIGLLVQLKLSSKPIGKWVAFFEEGQDMVYRAEQAIRIYYYDRVKRTVRTDPAGVQGME
jgi:hypothetical protein